LGYGDRAACAKPEAKNRVVLYDARTKQETILYDKPLTNEFAGPDDACIFLQADLSPSGSTLYIVTPWAATSNRLVMIDVKTGAVSHDVYGVMDAYVIRGGTSEGDLIYNCRMWRDNLGHYGYPFVHAKPDGSQIAIVSDEYFTVGATEKPPILRAYLQKLRGRIYVDGRWIP
jgi:hypothetical protein